MCGITGYINLNNKAIKDSVDILNMLKIQNHRGPDDTGIRAFSLNTGKSSELETSVPKAIQSDFEGIIGFNRLSILDLSSNGHQPMVSPDGNVILALNGEIYNAFDIKPELENEGYKFMSITDTEVVLSLYLKEGFEKMIKRLNGMFAIVIIDLRERTVYFARDRFGIKPLYYIVNHDQLAFSSEVKSFLYLNDYRFELDKDKLDEYLIFRNNAEGTLFKGIKILSPGSYLTYRFNDGLKLHRYFNIDHYCRTTGKSESLEYFRSEMEKSLSNSVESQLMSDVKVGCQLSGGIDSSLVTWYANKTADRGKFESVSIILDNKNLSEEVYIDQVANQLGIRSHKFRLDSNYYLEQIKKATWHLESPLNHPNSIGIYLLSQLAREHVTVLLSGEGADEVFGGYRRFYHVTYPYLNNRFLSKLRKGFSDPQGLLKYFDNVSRAVMTTAYMSPITARSLYPSFRLDKATKIRNAIYKELNGSNFTKQVKYEILTYLPDLLIRQDKMSMAHSIENRVPFLDNSLVEKSFSIPQRFLAMRFSPEGRYGEKYILKSTAANYFGKDFAFRSKMGFGIPLAEFFGDSRFLEFLRDEILPGIGKRGIMNSTLVESWLNRIDKLSHVEIESFWIAIVFEIWASLYLDLNYENWNSSF